MRGLKGNDLFPKPIFRNQSTEKLEINMKLPLVSCSIYIDYNIEHDNTNLADNSIIAKLPS